MLAKVKCIREALVRRRSSLVKDICHYHRRAIIHTCAYVAVYTAVSRARQSLRLIASAGARHCICAATHRVRLVPPAKSITVLIFHMTVSYHRSLCVRVPLNTVVEQHLHIAYVQSQQCVSQHALAISRRLYCAKHSQTSTGPIRCERHLQCACVLLLKASDLQTSIKLMHDCT